MITVGFHPTARAELFEAAAYYERDSAGLGRTFIAEVERVVGMLVEQPRLGTPVPGYEHLRRWALRRFPYYLIYRMEQDEMFVLVVAHERRRPGYWQERV